MKIRNGFVSNSSSTSFVIGVKDKTITKVKMEVDVDLSELGYQITSIHDLLEYFDDRYCWNPDTSDDDEYCEKQFNKYAKVIESNKTIWICNASSEGFENPLEQFFCNEGLKECTFEKGVIVLDEGF
jgi:hypothetical protein